MNNYLNLGPFLVAMVSGLAGAFLYVYFRLNVKPRVAVSSNIAERQENDKKEWIIKIVNRATRDVIIKSVHLYYVKKRPVPGGYILDKHCIETISLRPPFLQKFDKKSEDAGYAVRIVVKENTVNEWDDDEWDLRLALFAEDAVTRTCKVFEKEYKNKEEAIVKGDFEIRDSMIIV